MMRRRRCLEVIDEEAFNGGTKGIRASTCRKSPGDEGLRWWECKADPTDERAKL
jgi:hypothetical protein